MQTTLFTTSPPVFSIGGYSPDGVLYTPPPPAINNAMQGDYIIQPTGTPVNPTPVATSTGTVLGTITPPVTPVNIPTSTGIPVATGTPATIAPVTMSSSNTLLIIGAAVVLFIILYKQQKV